MNGQPIKRRDPFARPLKQEAPVKEEKNNQQEEFIEEEVVEEEEIVEVPVQQPVVRPVVQKQAPKQSPKTSRQGGRVSYIQETEVNRQKYTATMDVQLRRKIKIVCATRGIMFSEFIEMACLEKLNREGER